MAFFGDKTYLGAEIGTTTIKLVELIKSGKEIRLKNYGILETYGYLERFNNALQTSSLKALESEISAYLSIILQRAKIRSRNATVSLPAFSAFTTLIELPDIPEGELPSAMAFQAKQYVPLPIASVKLDYIKVGERTDENGLKLQQIFLVSIPNEQIDRYQKIFNGASLNLNALEVEGMSLARVLTKGIKEATMIVDLGARSTSFAVAKDGFLRFEAQTDFAGGSLTQALASGMNISPRRAEELKQQRGLLAAGAESELSTLMLPILDVIINEARRAKENFEKSYKEGITSLVLTGGGANLLGIEDYFTKQLAVKTVRANPFRNIIYPPEIEPIIKKSGPAFAVALGAAIRNLV